MSSIMPTALASSHNEPASRFRDCPPPDFDASACPILAQHWFKLRPDAAAEGIPGNPRFQEAQAA